ncbi:NUDIX domain-containing protein [Streptomyces sp. NPDC059651]|uniref:bifunctional class I SAM-dependent methyltransferase/NUDIX hydrolase n=1 Tax=Streptomyces sp. NPDC059651 TaxID=3346897 RepID=UPI0036ACB045
MDSEQINLRTWNAYGTHHLARGTEIPEADRLSWGPWPTGPGAEILGDLTGRRVLDLGSGIGRHAAHLVREHAAVVDAIDSSPGQHRRACDRYGDLEGLRLLLGDAVDHLRSTEAYDVIYSIDAVPYIDPRRLIPALAPALKPGGRLCFTTLHTNSLGNGPSQSVTARPEVLPLAGGDDLTVHMWVLAPELWEDLLTEHGLRVESVDALDSPDSDDHVSYRVFRVRRHTCVTSPPRSSRPPAQDRPPLPTGTSAREASSTAVMLVNRRGQYLLHLRDANKPICDPGTWSLVGGAPEGAETLDEAIAREIHEETGLTVPGLVPYAQAPTTGPHLTSGRILVYVGHWDGDADALPVTEGIMFRWFDVATMKHLTMCAWAHEVILAHHAEQVEQIEQPASEEQVAPPGPDPTGTT